MTTKKFSDLGLLEPIQRAVTESGYTTPTPIQLAAIPPLLEGRDLLGCAQTGTGKTAAFALPILQLLAKTNHRAEPKQARALVLTPTRELAVQIYESFCTYGKHMRFRSAVIFGGVGQGPQVNVMARGVDVLIATPGRLLDLINQRHVSLRNLEIFVLDEADRMLDMGFIVDIRKIITMLPPQRQSLFFSATMPPQIDKLASELLTSPVFIETTPVSSTVDSIKQLVMFVDKSNKKSLLKHILQDGSLKRVIIFTRTKHGANQVGEVLDKGGIPNATIHGNKSQNARQKALKDFRDGKVRALVATDIASRGIDIDNISHVINFELPNVGENYVHRIGRTARAGTTGTAISFCDGEERAYLKDIEKLIKQTLEVITDHPFHSTAPSYSAPSRGRARPEGGHFQKRRAFGSSSSGARRPRKIN